MNNAELLRYAAKARGADVWTDCDGNFYIGDSENREVFWNPIDDDADAFGLFCNLPAWAEVSPSFFEPGAWPSHRIVECSYRLKDRTLASVKEYLSDHFSRNAAARMAIVRVAAEIGRRAEA